MSTADKIGLLPGFGWVTDHEFLPTLVICLMITPVGHLVVGLVGESRLVPLSPGMQFLSFFPGDLFLGAMAAGLFVRAQNMPSESRWYNATWWHLLVLIVALLVATGMTYLEWKSGVYPTRAIFSPTKIYHNLLLYGGYGYVITVTLVALAFGSAKKAWVLVVLPGLVWGVLVVKDNSLSAAEASEKAQHAHVEDWRPIWQRS